MKATAASLEQDLRQFYGTEEWHRLYPNLLLTDGAKFLADKAECYWLFDIVFSILPKVQGKDTFFVVELTLGPKKVGAEFVAHNGNIGETDEEIFHVQYLPYTDFPLDHIKLFVVKDEHGWVAMLPSEY